MKRLALLPLALLLSACTGGTETADGGPTPVGAPSPGPSVSSPPAGPAPVNASYAVTFDPASYDPELTPGLLDLCASRPGATLASSDDNLPPAVTVSFRGTTAQQREVTQCLSLAMGEATQGVKVVDKATGQRVVPDTNIRID